VPSLRVYESVHLKTPGHSLLSHEQVKIITRAEERSHRL